MQASHQEITGRQDQAQTTPSLIEEADSTAQRGTEPSADEGEGLHTLNDRHEQWLREQYLRDAEAVGRTGHQETCFLTSMGRLHAARGGHAG